MKYHKHVAWIHNHVVHMTFEEALSAICMNFAWNSNEFYMTQFAQTSHEIHKKFTERVQAVSYEIYLNEPQGSS